jgi:hypothetical protein
MNSQAQGWSIAILTLGFLTAHCSTVTAEGLLDHLRDFGQASDAVGEATSKSAVASKLKSFTASGLTTQTLSTGPCPGTYPAIVRCSSINCDQLTVSGPINATSLGASTFAGCFTINDTPYDPFFCSAGVGTGTITSKNGKNSITLAFGGSLCEADAFPLPTPTGAYLNINGAYVIESGTGSFSSSVGAGQLSFSFLFTSAGVSAVGPVSINGNLAH